MSAGMLVPYHGFTVAAIGIVFWRSVPYAQADALKAFVRNPGCFEVSAAGIPASSP